MSDASDVEPRLAVVASVSALAKRLLSIARQSTVQTQIQFALRDLTEAQTWLEQPAVNSAPSILRIVDLCLHHAEGRLAIAETLLQMYGPEAPLSGAPSV